MKNNKGAITIIVLATTLFMIAFLISTYTIIANRRQTQAEIKRETKAVYEKDLNKLDEIYSNYIAEEYDQIPIYSVEELLQVASGKDVAIGGKIYTLSKSANYKLMNDIEFYTRDYVEKYENSFEQVEITDEITGQTQTGYKWIDIEEQIINGTFIGNFDYNGKKAIRKNRYFYKHITRIY